jgi:hypothetical protein
MVCQQEAASRIALAATPSIRGNPTAEHADGNACVVSSQDNVGKSENAEALENPSVDWKTLKLCALGDLRVDKSLVFTTVQGRVIIGR